MPLWEAWYYLKYIIIFLITGRKDQQFYFRFFFVGKVNCFWSDVAFVVLFYRAWNNESSSHTPHFLPSAFLCHYQLYFGLI